MTGALPATSSLHRIQQGRAATATHVLTWTSAGIHAAGQLLLDCLGLHWRQLCSRAVLKGDMQLLRALLPGVAPPGCFQVCAKIMGGYICCSSGHVQSLS